MYKGWTIILCTDSVVALKKVKKKIQVHRGVAHTSFISVQNFSPLAEIQRQYKPFAQRHIKFTLQLL